MRARRGAGGGCAGAALHASRVAAYRECKPHRARLRLLASQRAVQRQFHAFRFPRRSGADLSSTLDGRVARPPKPLRCEATA
jgi:hypothetical protein